MDWLYRLLGAESSRLVNSFFSFARFRLIHSKLPFNPYIITIYFIPPFLYLLVFRVVVVLIFDSDWCDFPSVVDGFCWRLSGVMCRVGVRHAHCEQYCRWLWWRFSVFASLFGKRVHSSLVVAFGFASLAIPLAGSTSTVMVGCLERGTALAVWRPR